MLIDEEKHPGINSLSRVMHSDLRCIQVLLWFGLRGCGRLFSFLFYNSVATLLQPMDVIKTRQQGYYHRATLQQGSTLEMKENIKWQIAAKNIYKERGLLGFWDGLVGCFVIC